MSITITTAILIANCPAIQQYNTTLLLADATNSPGNSPSCDSVAFQDAPWTQKQRRNATRQDFAHIYGGGGGCMAIVNGCAISADATPLMIDVSAGKILAPGYHDVTPNGGAPWAVHDNKAAIYVWMDYLGNLTNVDNSITPPGPNLVFLGTVGTSGGAIFAIDISGVCYLVGGRVIRSSADDGAPTDTPPATVSLLHNTAFAPYEWAHGAYKQVHIPQLSADPTTPQDGDIWLRTDLSQLKTKITGVMQTVGASQFSEINCTFNGGGAALAGGMQAVVRVPWDGIIVEATLMADLSGSCVVDIWNAAFGSYPPTIANTITASDLPTLSSSKAETDTTLTGWTTAFAAGSVFLFNLNSSSTIENLVVALKVRRN